MPLAAYRVCRRIWSRLDGEGAKRVGGRWNTPGRPVVYMAESIALAILENLVHMSKRDYPVGYVSVCATIPDHLNILEYSLFLDSVEPSDPNEKIVGDTWLRSKRSAVLRVPSAVVNGASNYLINPEHIDFAQIKIDPPAVLSFDPRLFISIP